MQKRAVDARPEPFAHFDPTTDKRASGEPAQRARGKQAGDVERRGQERSRIDQLTQELAYEYWHRMLFARFLAENHLLMHPDGVAVSLEECEELAAVGAGTQRLRPGGPLRQPDAAADLPGR